MCNPGCDEAPVFLLGTGRCGSTFFQKVISSASDVWIWGEHDGVLASLLMFYERVQTSNPLKQFAFFEKDQDLLLLVNSEAEGDATPLAWANGFRPNDAAAIVTRSIDSLMRCKLPAGKTRWGFKEIRYGYKDRHPETMLNLFPQSVIVHTARHPRETLASSLSAWARDAVREALDSGSTNVIENLYEEYSNRWLLFSDNMKDLSRRYMGRVVRARIEFFQDDLKEVFSVIGGQYTVPNRRPVNERSPIIGHSREAERDLFASIWENKKVRFEGACHDLGYEL